MRKFDLIIIGSGSGNSFLDARFEHLDVALVEHGTFGGTCLNVGCIPTKMLVHPADVARSVARAGHLGIDATIRYGLHVPGTQALRESQLQSDNPYNTRKFAGLPPTPIGNPGLASMQAAAHPAKVPYLYFVRKPDKVHHYFTASYQDFINHEIQYGYK